MNVFNNCNVRIRNVRMSKNEEYLYRIKELVENSIKTLKEITEEHKISYYSLNKMYKINKIPRPITLRGPNKKKVSEENRRLIEKFREQLSCGITKQYQRLRNENKTVSYRDVRKVYEENGWSEPREKVLSKNRVTYEACHVNLIWHVDIHFFRGNKRYPIYGIMDDRSRYILLLRFIGTKESKKTAQAAIDAIVQYGKPYCFWGDNGTENLGEFRDLLIANGIVMKNTKPYNPEQNGKIERFWKFLEDCVESLHEIPKFVRNYNTTPHLSLPFQENSRIHMTPKYVFENFPKYEEGVQGLWKVDGEILNFK